MMKLNSYESSFLGTHQSFLLKLWWSFLGTHKTFLPVPRVRFRLPSANQHSSHRQPLALSPRHTYFFTFHTRIQTNWRHSRSLVLARGLRPTTPARSVTPTYNWVFLIGSENTPLPWITLTVHTMLVSPWYTHTRFHSLLLFYSSSCRITIFSVLVISIYICLLCIVSTVYSSTPCSCLILALSAKSMLITSMSVRCINLSFIITVPTYKKEY